MIYLTIPLAVWGLTIALLRYAFGQSGFDRFFWHFSILCAVGFTGAVLYRTTYSEVGFWVFAVGVSVHSIGLLLYAVGAACLRKLRRGSSRATLA